MKMRRISMLATLLVLAASAVHADEAFDDIQWNGFLNVVGGALRDAPKEDFSGDPQTPGYFTFGDDLSFDQLSSAGLQANKRLDEDASVTLQMLAQGAEDNYDAELEWLYLTYTPSYRSSFRIGRIGSPIYYYSDFLNVGYAYHWVRPPDVVYSLDASMTGVNYVYSDVWKSIEWAVELSTGTSNEHEESIGAQVKTRDNLGATFSMASSNGLSFRYTAFTNKTTLVLDSLSEDNLAESVEHAVDLAMAEQGLTGAEFDSTRSTLLQATQARLDNGALDLEDLDTTFLGAALRYETDRWFVMTEWIGTYKDSYLYSDYQAGFITGGMHFGTVLYHLTYSQGAHELSDEAEAERRHQPPDDAQLSDYADTLANVIRTKMAGAFARNNRNLLFGVRYDLSRHMAVKMELSRIREQATFDGDDYGIGDNLLFRSALNVKF